MSEARGREARGPDVGKGWRSNQIRGISCGLDFIMPMSGVGGAGCPFGSRQLFSCCFLV